MIEMLQRQRRRGMQTVKKKKSFNSVTGVHCKPLHCRALKARLQGAERCVLRMQGNGYGFLQEVWR